MDVPSLNVALRSAQSFVHTLMDSIHIGICQVNTQGHILSLNLEGARILQRTEQLGRSRHRVRNFMFVPHGPAPRGSANRVEAEGMDAGYIVAPPDGFVPAERETGGIPPVQPDKTDPLLRAAQQGVVRVHVLGSGVTV